MSWPYACAIPAPLLANLLTLLVLAYSIWVGIDGAVFDQSTLANVCVVNNYANIARCEFLPGDSVLWYPLVNPQPISAGEKIFIGYCVLIFCYLAFPLLLTLGRQLKTSWLTVRSELLTRQSWHS